MPEIDIVLPELWRMGDEVVRKVLRTHRGIVDQDIEPVEGIDRAVDGDL